MELCPCSAKKLRYNVSMGCRVVEQDELIECPGCALPIAKLKKPFIAGQAINPHNYEWLIAPLTWGDETRCPKCDEYWKVGTYLHVAGKGWQPI